MKGTIYYEAIATVIFSHVKITCYFHMWRYQVFVRKLTWYFTGVYIIIRLITTSRKPHPSWQPLLLHKMHKFCEYYSVFNHRMTWNHDWIQSWTTWKRPYVKKKFEKFFIFFMDISIHDSLSIHFKITRKSSFSLCTWTLFLGIQTSTCCLSIFWKTSYSVAIIL